MILADGRSAADHGQHQKEQAGYFQPEHVQHVSDAAQVAAPLCKKRVPSGSRRSCVPRRGERPGPECQNRGVARFDLVCAAIGAEKRYSSSLRFEAWRAHQAAMWVPALQIFHSLFASKLCTWDGKRVKVLEALFECARVTVVRSGKQTRWHHGQPTQRLDEGTGRGDQQSLSDSDEIAEVISRIKAGGYDVFLVLEATIGLNQRDEDAVEKKPHQDAAIRRASFEITSQDVKFLKSLRISVDDVTKR